MFICFVFFSITLLWHIATFYRYYSLPPPVHRVKLHIINCFCLLNSVRWNQDVLARRFVPPNFKREIGMFWREIHKRNAEHNLCLIPCSRVWEGVWICLQECSGTICMRRMEYILYFKIIWIYMRIVYWNGGAT